MQATIRAKLLKPTPDKINEDNKKKRAAPIGSKKTNKRAKKTKAVKKTITGTDSIKYPGTKKRAPLHYGPATVFWDMPTNGWRVKPCSGSRVAKGYKFTDKPKQQWENVLVPILEKFKKDAAK